MKNIRRTTVGKQSWIKIKKGAWMGPRLTYPPNKSYVYPAKNWYLLKFLEKATRSRLLNPILAVRVKRRTRINPLTHGIKLHEILHQLLNSIHEDVMGFFSLTLQSRNIFHTHTIRHFTRHLLQCRRTCLSLNGWSIKKVEFEQATLRKDLLSWIIINKGILTFPALGLI